jgi:hypothetical protein
MWRRIVSLQWPSKLGRRNWPTLVCISHKARGRNINNVAPNLYGDSWEKFWGTVSDDPQDVLWNAPHEQAVAIDWQHLKEFVDAEDGLPLVDVGCGDGTQTTFFSGCVQQTIGVDVSQAAIVDIANKSNNTAEGVTYQVLDLLNDTACHDFHESTGDAHVYMRGVLMQFLPTDCR